MARKNTVFIGPTAAEINDRTRHQQIDTSDVLDEQIESYEQAVRETLKKEEENKQKMQNLLKYASRTLFHEKSFFPFDLFPDELLVEEHKITIVNHSFFFIKHIRSILVKDIANVTVSTSFLFASIAITDQYFTRHPVQVNYLWRKAAIRARRIIQGLIVADKEQVDFSRTPIDEVTKRLIDLGKIKEESAA